MCYLGSGNKLCSLWFSLLVISLKSLTVNIFLRSWSVVKLLVTRASA